MEVVMIYCVLVNMNLVVCVLVVFNCMVMYVVGVVVVVLVVVEIVVLLIGVIYCYVLYDFLVWLDELVLILFIWLLMLGVVLVLDCGEYMWFIVIINKCFEKGCVWFEMVVVLVVCIFVLMVIYLVVDYVVE